MALTQNDPTIANAIKQLDPAKYTALGDFIDEVNAPDVRKDLVKTYGDQGITGFLKLTGAVKSAGTADSVVWWEETRLHEPQVAKFAAAADGTGDIAAADTDGFGIYDGNAKIVRVGDVILVDGDRARVKALTSGTAFEIEFLNGFTSGVAAAAAAKTCPVVYNLFAQGTDHPEEFLESNVNRFENSYNILKETFKVTGSQMTNVGYIDLGGGDYRWYIKGETDTRRRFEDKIEMACLLSENTSNLTDISGSEGYFAALQDRGMVQDGLVSTFTELDALVTKMDVNRCPAEYAMYVNTAQGLAIDNMLSGVGSNGGGLQGSFGAFNNDKDMAVNLGFKSFTRGGYTFHKHDWKLLNDPTLMGGFDGTVAGGAMIPLKSVVDPRTGASSYALEMNYKAANGYSRAMEHWLTGGVNGVYTDGRDVLQCNYRAEVNLCVKAANQHVLIQS